MAFLGGSWNDERDEREKHIGPLSHWGEDLDDDNYSGMMSSHFNGKMLLMEQPESHYESLLRRLDEEIEKENKK